MYNIVYFADLADITFGLSPFSQTRSGDVFYHIFKLEWIIQVPEYFLIVLSCEKDAVKTQQTRDKQIFVSANFFRLYVNNNDEFLHYSHPYCMET